MSRPRCDLFHVESDDDDSREALVAVQALEQHRELLAGAEIESRGRFVQQQE